jgi:hypothetical protein
MNIEYKFSTADIADVRNLLNEFLKRISIVALSRTEVEMADPERRFIGSCNNEYLDIVKVINRWGIKDDAGTYYNLLNGVIGRITSHYPMLQIYAPVQLLLFNKLLEGWSKGIKTEFTKEEVEIFFLQPYNMIGSSYISQSAVCLNESIIIASQKLSAKLKSADSKEFLAQGVGRRLFMLKENVNVISNIYCDRRIKPLDDNENAILAQNINFFYANIYAILDCLAFVLAFECPDYIIRRHNKDDYSKIGLFNKTFYQKINGLSDRLSLMKLRPWYKEISDLRHPIAHRIPLYFPEIFHRYDSHKNQEVDSQYYDNRKTIYEKIGALTNDANDIDKRNNQVSELNDQMNRLDEERRKAKENINVFSGCFLHSYEETKKYYHLSRLTLDLGILCYLLDKSFEYLGEIGV